MRKTKSKIVGIYKITNPAGQFYIGQSMDVKQRFNNHKYSSVLNKTDIQDSIVLHGYKNHVFEILEECDKSILLERERFYINSLNPILNGVQGRPKGSPTCTPSLRCHKSDWELMKSLHKGKVNKMFNQWVKEQIKQD